MSYHEKRAFVSMFSSIVIFAVYSVYLYARYLAGNPEAAHNLRFWGWAFLAYVLVSIVARIIITIVFTIVYRLTTNDSEPSFSDERDKLIELKATRNSCYVSSIGVALAISSLVINIPDFTMIIVLVVSCLLGQITENLTQLRLYGRGF